MNKAELVSKVADKTGFKKKDAEAALDAVLGTIEESLVAGVLDLSVSVHLRQDQERLERVETLRSQRQLLISQLQRHLFSRQESRLRMQ